GGRPVPLSARYWFWGDWYSGGEATSIVVQWERVVFVVGGRDVDLAGGDLDDALVLFVPVVEGQAELLATAEGVVSSPAHGFQGFLGGKVQIGFRLSCRRGHRFPPIGSTSHGR